MAPVQTEAKPVVNKSQALEWLRQMILIRRFEERAEMLYQKGNKIGGFFHQYSGQEPVAVGSIGVLREDDYVITAYRDHGHALALGMSARAGMAELLGKVLPELGDPYASLPTRLADASWVGCRLAEILPLELGDKISLLATEEPLARLERLELLMRRVSG